MISLREIIMIREQGLFVDHHRHCVIKAVSAAYTIVPTVSCRNTDLGPCTPADDGDGEGAEYRSEGRADSSAYSGSSECGETSRLLDRDLGIFFFFFCFGILGLCKTSKIALVAFGGKGLRIRFRAQQRRAEKNRVWSSGMCGRIQASAWDCEIKINQNKKKLLFFFFSFESSQNTREKKPKTQKHFSNYGP
jgi:hypothetical protein